MTVNGTESINGAKVGYQSPILGGKKGNKGQTSCGFVAYTGNVQMATPGPAIPPPGCSQIAVS